MRRSLAVIVVAMTVACGPSVSKKPGDGTSQNNVSVNNNPNNVAVNSSVTNNVTTGPVNGTSGPVNGTSGPPDVCDVLVADTTPDYCNLQATCGGSGLAVECESDGTFWYCYCGDQALEYESNPCDDPGSFAPLLAEDCGVTSTGAMSGCTSSGFESPDNSCSYGVKCGDEHEYAVACDQDLDADVSYCTCYVDGEAIDEFSAEGLTCEVGNDDFSWWNDGCGWALQR